jgi:hypothetical protein
VDDDGGREREGDAMCQATAKKCGGCGKSISRSFKLPFCDACRRARRCGDCGRSLALNRDASPLCWTCKPAPTARQEAARERAEMLKPLLGAFPWLRSLAAV